MMKRKVKSFFDPSVSGKQRVELEQLFYNGVPRDAVQIYRGARNTLYRLTLGDGTDVCVKHFRKAKFPNSYIYTTFRHSKARRSYEHALKLMSAGFLTPQPMAYSETKTGIKLRESYYVCLFEPLDNLRNWDTRSDGEAVTSALAAEMLRLHRAGILNRDFSPGNLLLRKGADGRYEFMYVDLNRMKFGVSSRPKLMGMFRSISLDSGLTDKLATAYAEVSGEDVDAVRKEALESLERYKRIKRRHRFFKRLIKRKK